MEEGGGSRGDVRVGEGGEGREESRKGGLRINLRERTLIRA
jgi:hypothetical protein